MTTYPAKPASRFTRVTSIGAGAGRLRHKAVRALRLVRAFLSDPQAVRRAIIAGFVGATALMLLCGGNSEPADYCRVMVPMLALSALMVWSEFGGKEGTK